MAFNQVTNLDFDDIKKSLKEYLRSSEVFTDYNFEGSVLSQLIDVLSYNTYYTAMNANLVANEAFFDSASIRENVVSLAKLVGYTPRSAAASKATVTFDIQVSPNIKALTMKKGISFIGSNGSGSYTFSILDDITRESYIDSNGLRRITFNDIEIYQGNLLTSNYTVDTSTTQRFIIPNADSDIELTRVIIQETGFTIPQSYKKAVDITEIGPKDRIFFIQENKNEQFELIFGDDTFGKKLQNKDIITIEYFITDKDIANECSEFEFVGSLEYGTQIISDVNSTITVTTASAGGAQPESISSIKYLAPRYYAAQNRAVTIRDYETLINRLVPNLESLTVYGGEDADPPQYGKVFIVAKPKGSEALTTTGKQNLLKSIREYTILSVIPEIKDPSYLYLEIESYVYFDSNKTRRSQQEIAELVRKTIFSFGESRDVNKFKGKFKHSKLVSLIDSVDPGITSNITRVKMRKNLPILSNIFASYQVCYGNRISESTDVSSTAFKITGENPLYNFYFEKLGTNTIAIYRIDGSKKVYYNKNIGNIDYERGEINISAININSATNGSGYIEFSVKPASNDIISLRDLYLLISEEDITVVTILDQITSASRSSGVGQIPVSS
jgi:hypothetical protein